MERERDIGRKDTVWGNKENILTERTQGGETGKIYWHKGHMVEKQGKYIDRKDTWLGNRENILTERKHGGETGKIY